MKSLFLSFVLVMNFAWTMEGEFIHKPWDMLTQIKVDPESMLLESQKLSKLGMDIAGVNYQEGTIDILLTDAEYKYLTEQGYDILIREVHGVTKAPDQEYKTPGEIQAILTEIHEQNADITKLVSVGKSLEGRDIWAIKISDNAAEDEGLTEPRVLFNSMHHAREVMTPEVALDIIDQLIDGYRSGDSSIQAWVNGLEIWVMPMFNVDGNHKMWTADRWWRKNTRGGHGVDINRNYPSTWNTCNGSSGFPYSQTYRGQSAGSEPETQVMMDFVGKIRPVFNISYHSYSEIVIYPFGCSSNRTPTKDIVESIGHKIGEAIDYKAGTAWELLYDVDGGDIDWMYNAYGVIPYVIEVNSSSEGFHPDYAKWRDVTVERNRGGWKYLLQRTFGSGIRGVLSNAGGLVSDYIVKVFKNGKFYQSMKSHENGVFHIVLNPGQYTLQFASKNDHIMVEKEVAVGDSLLYLEIESGK